MRTCLSLSLLIVALLFPPSGGLAQTREAVDPYMLERLLPEETALYGVLPNHPAVAEAIRGTKLHQLTQDEEVKAFLKTFEGHIRMVTVPADEKLKPLGVTLNGLIELLRTSSLSIAVIDIPDEGRKPKDVVIAVGPRSTTISFPAILAKTREHIASSEKKVALQRKEYKGKTYEEFGQGEKCLFHVAIDGTYLFATSRERLEKMIDASVSPSATSLASSARFRRAAGKVAPRGKEVYFLYANAAPFIDKAMGKAKEHDRHMAEILGLTAVDSLALSLAPNGENFKGTFFVGTKGEKKGLVKLFSPQPIASKNLKYVPANAFFCAMANIDGRATVNTILDLARQAEGENFKGDRKIAKLDEKLGISFVDDFLGSIGNDVVLSAAFPEAGGLLPEVLAIASLNDPAKFERSFAAIVEQTSLRGVQQTLYGGSTIKVANIVLDDASYLISGKSAVFPLSYFIRDNTLFLSSSPSVLKRQIKRMNATGVASLPQSPKFMGIAGDAQGPAGALCYLDMEAIFNILANTISPFLGYAQLFIDQKTHGGLPFRAETLPLGETIGNYIGQTLIAVGDDPDGIRAEVNTTFPFVTGYVYLALSLFGQP